METAHSPVSRMPLSVACNLHTIVGSFQENLALHGFSIERKSLLRVNRLHTTSHHTRPDPDRRLQQTSRLTRRSQMQWLELSMLISYFSLHYYENMRDECRNPQDLHSEGLTHYKTYSFIQSNKHAQPRLCGVLCQNTTITLSTISAIGWYMKAGIKTTDVMEIGEVCLWG